MKEISCKVIEDLMPLIQDGVASDESVELVRHHMKSCDKCKNEFNHTGKKDLPQIKLEDEKIIRKIKRRVISIQKLALIFGTILGVALSYTVGMFYNIAIMPLLGGISYLSLNRKWYLAPIGIMLLSYIWQVSESLVLGYFSWKIYYGALTLTFIYGGLVFLGVIIAYLIKYSLGKGDLINEG